MGSLLLLALGLGGAALGGVALFTRANFLRRVDQLQRSLEQKWDAPPSRADLPPEVVALALRLGVPAGARGRLVRLTQSGEMWLKPGAKPLAFTAQQTFAIAKVGFLWQAWFRIGGPQMLVVDYLVEGEGGLEGRLLSAFPIVRVIGGDITFRGEAMRYLAELMWIPDALLFNPQLEWRVIDARTLAVATGNGARRSEVRIILDDAGDPVRAHADDRPRADGRVITTCPWFTRGTDYRSIGGRRIPMRGEAGWILDGIEFIYFRGRIESWSLEA